MRIGKCSGLFALTILALNGSVAPARGQTIPGEPASPEVVAKLIAQLGAMDFRTRDQASLQLEKLGSAVLPALRKAAAANPELEIKLRLEAVAHRIESGLLKAEDKLWQHLDVPGRGLKDRLVRILANKPALSDAQVASAIYLLTVGRPPTNEERKRAERLLAAMDGRMLNALQLARALVQGKEYRAEIAAASAHLLKVQADLAADTEVPTKLARLNAPEFEKLINEVGAALHKATAGDERVIDLAFLVVLSRFPTAANVKTAVAHLQRAPERVTAARDIVWDLVNTSEFSFGQ
jgi:hypothetical protein